MLTPTVVAPAPPDTVLERDSDPGMDGSGGIGRLRRIGWWVINRDDPNVNVTVELYAGRLIIGAAVSGRRRVDGTHNFEMAIPRAYLDGQPHEFNLRFGGTPTIVSGARATLTCDPH